jgi:hypothetical protein
VEFFVFIGELIIGALDLATLGADLYAWFKGRDNRRERRAAKRAGMPPPPRDRWNRRVIVFSVVAVALTAFLLVRLTR